MDFSDMRALQSLLCPPTNESDSSDDDLPQFGTAKLGPGNVGPASKQKPKEGESGDCRENPKSIWSKSEVQTEVVCDPTEDPRKMPEYDIKFRQSVTPEDVYLQMGNKTPGTASCEEIVVTVSLPGEKRQQVNVNVTETHLDVHSLVYRLHLALPHPVDPNSGKAEWQTDTNSIQVAVKMVREFDFVNF